MHSSDKGLSPISFWKMDHSCFHSAGVPRSDIKVLIMFRIDRLLSSWQNWMALPSINNFFIQSLQWLDFNALSTCSTGYHPSCVHILFKVSIISLTKIILLKLNVFVCYLCKSVLIYKIWVSVVTDAKYLTGSTDIYNCFYTTTDLAFFFLIYFF